MQETGRCCRDKGNCVGATILEESLDIMSATGIRQTEMSLLSTLVRGPCARLRWDHREPTIL